jgi:hypothetical protein
MDNEAENTKNWKTQTLIMGALIGALIGLGTAFLLARAAEKKGEGPPEISTRDALSTGIAIIGVIRGIASLGDKKK